MPQKPIIPGGRPRSSSYDDVLDIDDVRDGLCGTLFVNLNDRNNCTDGPRRIHMTRGHHNNVVHTSASNLNYSDDALDSDSKLSSGSSALSGRKGLTLKSMRKAVSRVFVKETKLTDASVKKTSEKPTQVNDRLRVWTPDLRYLGEDNVKSGETTLSTTRPLVTSFNFGMPIPKWTRTPGVVGIFNHGNNCFMNAILQCLSNTDSFTEYFVRDFFKNDLKNSANGKKGVFRSSHGKVTEQLAHFLKSLWSGKYTSEISEEFKSVVAKFNSQYEGDDQHDAQEFLLWLLDRIHEDVSTFTKRKAKSQKVSLMRTDRELAAEASLANGESFVLRLFQALHSSTLTCRTCGECSNTFDPYLCLSLPLPQGYQCVVYVIVVFLDARDPQQVMMAFTLNQHDEVRQLKERIASGTGIPAKQLLLVQLEEDCFGTTYHDEQHLCDIPEHEAVYAFEVHPEETSRHSAIEERDSLMSELLVMHVEVTNKSSDSYRFASPAVLKVRRDITWADLHMEILKKMENALSDEVFTHQNLDSLFLLRIYDGNSRKYYLPSDVEMPLYTQYADRALMSSKQHTGLPHFKLIAEWDTKTKSRFVIDDREHIERSPSVRKAENSPLGQGKVTLEECFRLYTKEEKLIGDDAWLCPHCNHQQQGTIKSLNLWTLPDVLILHLKRFKQSGPRRSKLNTLIDFPIDGLNMSELVSRHNHGNLPIDDYMFDLMAVSNHYGNMMGGHYTAYCRNPIDGNWREYDDAKVETLRGSVITKEAYLLFYQRRSLSKSVNQRLFTGDHWIYSLSLSPSEMTADKSTTHLSSELTQQTQKSRSRSVSPSAHRQNKRGINTHNTPGAPLTPQPLRHPVTSLVGDKGQSDDSSLSRSPLLKRNNSSRRSRSLQRQPSSSHTQLRHDTLDNSVGLDDRRPSKRNSPDMGERESFRSKLSQDISRGQTYTSKMPTDVDRPPTGPVNLQDYTPTARGLGAATSKNITSNSPMSKEILTSSPSSSTVSTPQKSQGNKNSNQIRKSPHEPPTVSQGENAARKLADIMKQDIINKAQAHAEKTNNVDYSLRGEFRKHGAMNKANLKDNLDDSMVFQVYTTNSGLHSDSFDSEPISTDNELQNSSQNMRQLMFEQRDAKSSMSSRATVTGRNLLPEKSAHLGSKQMQAGETNLSKFHKSLDKQFATTNGHLVSSHANRTSQFLYENEIMNSESKSLAVSSNGSSRNKSATISRTWRTSQVGKHEHSNIPHSNTDHNIRYGHSSHVPSLLTTSHSHGGEQTFIQAADSSSLQSSTSGYVTPSQDTSRRKHPTYNHESSQQLLSYQNGQISYRSRTLPGQTPGSRGSKFRFQRPRGVDPVQTESAAKNLANIANACLRESSV